MKTPKKEAASIGGLVLAIGIVSTVCITLTIISRYYYHTIDQMFNSYGVWEEWDRHELLSLVEIICVIINMVLGAISITELVLGAVIIKAKRIDKDFLLVIFSVILLVFSVLSIILKFIAEEIWRFDLSDYMFIAVVILSFIVVPKIFKFQTVATAYESAFSNNFQYDGEPVFVSGQKLNYGNTEKPQTVSQGFSYIEEEPNNSLKTKKRCVRCGRDNDINAKFCEACGYSKFINN